MREGVDPMSYRDVNLPSGVRLNERTDFPELSFDEELLPTVYYLLKGHGYNNFIIDIQPNSLVVLRAWRQIS